MIKLAIFTTSVFLILTSASLAQAPIRRDASAITLIQQSLSAMGLASSPNVRASAQGRITHADGRSEAISIETAGTDRYRCDLDGTKVTFVSNSGSGFLVMKGSRHALPLWVTQYKRPDYLPALSLMGDYLNPRLQIQYVALENVMGQPAHHLRISVRPTDGTPVQIADLISEFHVYIDQTSFLVLQTRTFDFSPETPVNRSPVETYFSDYRQQDGALVPFHLTRTVAGQPESDIVFTSISLNANIADSDFQ